MQGNENVTLGAEGEQKRLGYIQEAEIGGNKHFKGKMVASRIDLNTGSGDLFFMPLIKSRAPFFALLSPCAAGGRMG